MDRRAVAALILVQIIFGTLSVAGKFALLELSPLALAALRVTGAAALLLVLHRVWVRAPVARADLGAFFLLSILGIVVNQVLFLTGLSRTTAVDATVLVSTIPAFTIVLAIALGREGTTALRAAGVAVAFLGVLVLVGGGEFGSDAFFGNLLVTLNALSYSAYLVLSRPYLARHDPLTVVTWTFLFGALLVVPLSAGDLVALDWGDISVATWLSLVYIILFPSVVTYYLNNWALQRVPSSTVASFVYLQPLVAALLAVPLLQEPLSPRTLLAATLILSGVYAAQSRADLPRRVAGVR